LIDVPNQFQQNSALTAGARNLADDGSRGRLVAVLVNRNRRILVANAQRDGSPMPRLAIVKAEILS
jgi:hypothetical protein